MSTKAIEVVVTGRVQGVSFRAWTRETAAGLGLRGWVRNEADGSVRALFAGHDEPLKKMEEVLWRGPPAAHVERVAVSPASVFHGGGFEIHD